MDDSETLKCREIFVRKIKDENFYGGASSFQSLKQHHRGKLEGFSDQSMQRRWFDFLDGYKSAMVTP